MGASYSHTTRTDGTTLTASIYNADHQNHIDNAIPAKFDDESADAAAMGVIADPYPGGVVSLATSLQGEIHRLRYQIAAVSGVSGSWYVDPDNSITGLDARRYQIIKSDVATTSGTNVELTTGLASVKRVELTFNRVSLSGTDPIVIQLGTGATPTWVTTGYLSNASHGTTNLNSTVGFLINTAGIATGFYTGHVTLTYMDTDEWVSSGQVSNVLTAATIHVSTGIINLGAEMTAIRLDTIGGDTFDNGAVGISVY